MRCGSRASGLRITIVLDIVHVLEYLVGRKFDPNRIPRKPRLNVLAERAIRRISSVSTASLLAWCVVTTTEVREADQLDQCE
jgi:hypothetical protein